MRKRQKTITLLWGGLVILSWLVWFSSIIQNHFISIMNMFCFYLPICIVFTVCFVVYLVAVVWGTKRNKQALLPKGIKGFFTIAVAFCILFTMFSPKIYSSDTAKKKEQNFQQYFSLKHLIGEQYNEDDLYTKQKKNWGDTFYIHSVVLVNSEKLTYADPEIRTKHPNPIISYDIQYYQNIPPVLRSHMATSLHSDMELFVSNCAFVDSSQIKSYAYEDVQFQVYYDKYQDFQTERLILCAECGDDMLLLGFILEDETNVLSINPNYIIEQIAGFMQSGGQVENG